MYVDGSELEENDLEEDLPKHAECCEDAEADPAVVTLAVAKAAIMGQKSTAIKRVVWRGFSKVIMSRKLFATPGEAIAQALPM